MLKDEAREKAEKAKEGLIKVLRSKIFRAIVAAALGVAAQAITTGAVDIETITPVILTVLGYAAPGAAADRMSK